MREREELGAKRESGMWHLIEHDAMEVQMVGLQKAFGVICYELATDCREMLVFLKGHAAEIQDKEGDELLFPEPAFVGEPSCYLHAPTVE